MKTIGFYEAVEDRNAATEDFLRLFLFPGMDHCGGSGPGVDADGFDALTALEGWVEKGEAPDQLLSTKRDENGNVEWTRPVCSYPKRARYKGQGDVSDASSFECAEP